MSATVIILPVVARPNPNEVGKRALRVVVDRATLSRLKMRAAHWELTLEEVAAFVLSETLRPKGRKP